MKRWEVTPTMPVSQPHRHASPISLIRVVELVLVAFVIGFVGVRYSNYSRHDQANRLLLAKAIPIPSEQLPQPAPAQELPVAPPVSAGQPSEEAPAASNAESPQQIDEATADKDYAGAIALAALMPDETKRVGRPAPEFRVQDLDGNSTSLSSLRGKVVLLNLWATWCGICQAEMPSLERLYEEMKGYSDFTLLAVSVDQGDQFSKVSSFLANSSYRFPVTLDVSGQVSAGYDVRALPAAYVIDHNGRIAWGVAGEVDWSDPQVIRALQKML